MRLSDAVMLGVPELDWFHNGLGWFMRNRDDNTCGGCLVGAALYAVGSRVFNENAVEDFYARWPWIKNFKSVEHPCPSCRYTYRVGFLWGGGEFTEMLTHLVRHHNKNEITLEVIVDYVRSIEPPEEAPTPTEQTEMQAVAR